MSSSYCILLYSSLDKMHSSNILVLKAFLKKNNIIFEEIDGAQPHNKDMRNVLFNVAVQQGGSRDYPSAFVMKSDKTITYIGNWEHIQELLDAESIDESILKEHPEIMTFTRFFQLYVCL